MKKFAILAPLALAACATPSEPMIMAQVPPEPQVRIVEKPVYIVAPPEPQPEKLNKRTKRVSPEVATRQANKASVFMPSPEAFIGSTLEYPVVDGYLYNILTAPNEITSVELPPGCRFHAKSPYVADTGVFTPAHAEGEPPPKPVSNWEVAKSFHGGNKGHVSKALVRPRVSTLKPTTLHADTDCGVFRYKLIPTVNSANETVRFRKELSEMNLPEAPVAEDKTSQKLEIRGCDAMPVASAQFGYEVTGDQPVWAPTARDIWHNGLKDGGKTCIRMSDALAADEYPTSFIPVSGKEATVFNRITPGGVMEFDKVLPVVALRLNGEDVVIRLKR